MSEEKSLSDEYPLNARYQQTTSTELATYFPQVEMARMVHNGLAGIDLEELKERYKVGLKLAVEKDESERVSRACLREMIEVADGDWHDVETIKELYRRNADVSGQNYDLKSLFK